MSQIIEGAEAPAWLPETARRIVLVAGSSAGDSTALAAVELAELVAGHRPRTLLVNTVTGPQGLDAVLTPGGRPGLGEIVARSVRVGEAASTPPGRSFIFIPAGHPWPGMDALRDSPAFRHLVEAAGRGGTLLLHVAETDLADLFRGGPDFDGLVLLGGASAPAPVPAGIKLLGRVETHTTPTVSTRAPVAGAGSRSGFARPNRTPPIVAGAGSRKRPRGRLEKLVDDLRRRSSSGVGGVAAVWLVAVLAVWLVWQGLSGWPAFEDDFDSPLDLPASADAPSGGDDDPGGGRAESPPAAGAAETEAGAERAVPGSVGSRDSEATPPPAESAVVPGVELPYSVLVASSVKYEDAAVERDQLIAQGHMAFVSPTPIRGRLYFRVFVGALEDRLEASDLMRRLVETGAKDRERDWDMRPVRWAFALRDFTSEDEANDERRRLHTAGVPAYVLPVGDSTGATYRLYSGAFESEGAAGPADTLLSAAGQNATLVTRRGEPR